MRRIWSVALALCGSSGCSDQAVPRDVALSCDVIDCPDGLRCATRVGRCVPLDAETNAPGILAATAPARVRPGATFEILIEGDEAWAAVPGARLVASTFTRELALVRASAEGAVATFSATVPDDAADGDAVVLVDLVDVVGNASDLLRAATIAIDGTGPAAIAAGLRVSLETDPDALVIASLPGPRTVARASVPLDEAARNAAVACPGLSSLMCSWRAPW